MTASATTVLSEVRQSLEPVRYTAIYNVLLQQYYLRSDKRPHIIYYCYSTIWGQTVTGTGQILGHLYYHSTIWGQTVTGTSQIHGHLYYYYHHSTIWGQSLEPVRYTRSSVLLPQYYLRSDSHWNRSDTRPCNIMYYYYSTIWGQSL